MIKTKQERPALPSFLDETLRIAFHYAALAKQYKDRADQTRKQVQAYLEDNNDGFDTTIGVGIPTDYGSVIYQQRHNYRIDTDEIVAMMERGEMTIETLVNLAFPEGRIVRVEPLKVALGEQRFNAMTTESTTEFITLRPNASFKERIADLTTLPESYLREEFMLGTDEPAAEQNAPEAAEPAAEPIQAKSLAEILG